MPWDDQVGGVLDHAVLDNFYAGYLGTGILSGGDYTAVSGEMKGQYTAIRYKIRGKLYSAAADEAVHAAVDALPRADLVYLSNSGLQVVEGTPTARSSTQRQPPLPALPADCAMVAAVYIEPTDTEIVDAQIFDRRIMLPDEFRKKIAYRAYTDTTYADILETVMFFEANEIKHVRMVLPVAMSAGTTGGLKLRVSADEAFEEVAYAIVSSQNVAQGADAGTDVEDPIPDLRVGTSGRVSGAGSTAEIFALSSNDVDANLLSTDGEWPLEVDLVITNGADANEMVIQGAQNSDNGTTGVGEDGYIEVVQVPAP